MYYKLLLITTFIISLLVSCSDSTGPENDEFSIIKEIQFSDFQAWKMITSEDSGLVVAGVKRLKIGIIKFDSNGNKLWESIDSTLTERTGYFISNLQETNSKGFLVSGSDYFGNRFIIKFDNTGNVLWSKGPEELGDMDYLKAMENSSNEIIAVTTNAVIKYDENGIEIWKHYFNEGYSYNFSGTDYRVFRIYDCALNHDDRLIICYQSPICDLVKIVYEENGDYQWGEHYNINIHTNAKIILEDNTHYIFSTYEDIYREYNLFYTSSYILPVSTNGYMYSFEDQINFQDWIHSASVSKNNTVLLTPFNEPYVMKFSDIKNYDWKYELNDLGNNGHLYDALELDINRYAIIGEKIIDEGDSTELIEFMRIFQKN